MIDIKKLKKEIIEALKPLNPNKIILFGSYAYGILNEDSDIDLYIVTNDDFIPKTWREKSQIYLKVANLLENIIRKYSTDLIVHTKAMHEKFLKLNSHFSKVIMDKGIIL